MLTKQLAERKHISDDDKENAEKTVWKKRAQRAHTRPRRGQDKEETC